MEQLRAYFALDRGQVSRRRVAATFSRLWLLTPAMAWGHAGDFILAKCRTDTIGTVTLELSVDCLQHPTLTNQPEALAALRGVLALHSPAGLVALDSLAPARSETTATPDPDIPLSSDPGDAKRPHALVKLSYSWQPGVPEIRFAVPVGNAHDVLFWLAGGARPAPGPVQWRILIAGDVSPPVQVPVPSGILRLETGVRIVLAAAVGIALAGFVWWRRRSGISFGQSS